MPRPKELRSSSTAPATHSRRSRAAWPAPLMALAVALGLLNTARTASARSAYDAAAYSDIYKGYGEIAAAYMRYGAGDNNLYYAYYYAYYAEYYAYYAFVNNNKADWYDAYYYAYYAQYYASRTARGGTSFADLNNGYKQAYYAYAYFR